MTCPICGNEIHPPTTETCRDCDPARRDRVSVINWLRRRKHIHRWVYRPKTLGGWGVVKCSTCGYEDLW